MGDQMEIDPDLYGSSPQPTSHPLFAHREPPASLSSTKSFPYDGAWFTPVPHTASMRKGSKPSWIWAHGEELRDAKGRKHWRCNHCKTSKKTHINSCASNNNRANLHLQAAPHNLRPPKDAQFEDDVESIPTVVEMMGNGKKAIVASLMSIFSIERFRLALIRWIVCMNICLSVVEDASFFNLMLSVNSGLSKYLVKSHTTIRRWIIDEFVIRKEQVKKKIRNSSGMIHISFDLWTSPNKKAIVAICAHYLDRTYEPQHILIGLKEVHGSHAGANVAEVMKPVLIEMIPLERLGFFQADNDSKCDTTIDSLLHDLRPDIKDPRSRRVRCLGHIINLVVQAFMKGCEVIDVEESGLSKSQQKRLLEEWRNKGFYGKLHNLVVFIRASPQRRGAFKALGIVTDDVKGFLNEGETNKDLLVKLDNATRWNSTFLMIQRALLLQAKIKVFCAMRHDGEDLTLDILSDQEWRDLERFFELLKPFYDITIQTQGHAKKGMSGALWEALPAIEILLKHLEDAAVVHPFKKNGKNSFLAICVNNAWLKLKEYYTITDDSYHSYAAATLLNPAMRKAWFLEQWRGKELSGYVGVMEDKVYHFWKDYYKKDTGAAVEKKEIKNLIARTHYLQPIVETDDLFAYAGGERIRPEDGDAFNPIQWWVEKLDDLPTVAQYALDLLCCPVMSAECERVFSGAKLLISPSRNRLADDITEAAECLRIWWMRGIIED